MKKIFKQWKRAYDNQSKNISKYDNSLDCDISTGIDIIDNIPFALGDVLWIIMSTDSYFGCYDENATEYGVTKSGKWAAVDDGHCSCYGWEAAPNNITYYDTLQELLKCDNRANVIMEYKTELIEVYPFLKKYF